MVFGIHANERRSVIVVDLYFGKIRDAVFSFRKDAMTARAMELVQHFALFAFFEQQLPVDLCYVIGYIIGRLFFGKALLKKKTTGY